MTLPNFEGKRKFVYELCFNEKFIFIPSYQPKIIFIDEHLAGAKMSIARYQMSAKNYVGAIKNLNEVINRYRGTNQIYEAYFRLIEIYFHIGMKDEVLDLINILKETDPTNYWTLESLKFSPTSKKSSKLRIFSKDE